MKPVVLIDTDAGKVCDIIAAPGNEDLHSLGKYMAKYWQAEVTEEYDTGFAARLLVRIPGRPGMTLTHDSQTGNVLAAEGGGDIDRIAAEIIADLEARLAD